MIMAYEISIDRVVDKFKALAAEADTALCDLFCRSSIASVSDWLDPSKDLSGNDFKICYTSAVLAYYRYCLKMSDNSADFKAGEITVRENSVEKVQIAEKLLKDALCDIEPLCYGRRFAFMKV